MPAPNTSSGDVITPEAALKALEAALDPRDHTATLMIGEDQVPCLKIANRHADIWEYIYADGRSYWWSWGEPIAALGNPQAAASKIGDVLRATREPVDD